jgi:CubicO group peptidase (beta-lactamase class C family)
MSVVAVDRFGVVHAEDADAPFQAGSVSKPVAAFVALRLVDSGVLELDEDVNDRLVSWRLPGKD